MTSTLIGNTTEELTALLASKGLPGYRGKQLGKGLYTRFLRDYWHKRPLLIRNAIPGFAGLLSAAEMQTLASRDDVESRLIHGNGFDWQLNHGPFRKADFKRLPNTD